MMLKHFFVVSTLLISSFTFAQSKCENYFNELSLFIPQKINFNPTLDMNYSFTRTPIHLLSLEYEANALLKKLELKGASFLKNYQELSETQSVYSKIDTSQSFETKTKQFLEHISFLLSKTTNTQSQKNSEYLEYMQTLTRYLQSQEEFLKKVEDFSYILYFLNSKISQLPQSTQSVFHLYQSGSARILRTYQVFKPYFLAHIKAAQALSSDSINSIPVSPLVAPTLSHSTQKVIIHDTNEPVDYRTRLLKDVLYPKANSEELIETLQIVEKLEWQFAVKPSKLNQKAAYKSVIQEMRAWLKIQKMQDHLLLSHSGRAQTPLAVAITHKAEATDVQKFKQKFKDYFLF